MKKILLLISIVCFCLTVNAAITTPKKHTVTRKSSKNAVTARRDDPITITGTQICPEAGSSLSSATVSIINLPAGVTVTWSVNARLTLTGPPTGTTTTVEYNPAGGTSGPMRITATLSNGQVLGKIFEVVCE